MIVIHAIGGPICKDDKVVFTGVPGDAKKWRDWFERQNGISIHYVVDRKGNAQPSIAEERVAWHAKGRNENSIGIELVNRGDGKEKYPDEQITALVDLVKGIKSRHQDIVNKNIVRHSDIDNRKFRCGGADVDVKQDPGPKFPYEEFMSKISM